ncbi:MAG: hypothetical protein ABSF77_17665 [Spirochaetia bacterium]
MPGSLSDIADQEPEKKLAQSGPDGPEMLTGSPGRSRTRGTFIRCTTTWDRTSKIKNSRAPLAPAINLMQGVPGTTVIFPPRTLIPAEGLRPEMDHENAIAPSSGENNYGGLSQVPLGGGAVRGAVGTWPLSAFQG